MGRIKCLHFKIFGEIKNGGIGIGVDCVLLGQITRRMGWIGVD